MRLPGRLAIIAAVGAGALGVGVWASGGTWEDIRHWGQPRNVMSIGGHDVRVPHSTSAGARLSPIIAASTTGSHTFLFEEAGEPTRYDPCVPVAWVHNPAGMPAGAEGLVEDAVDNIAQYTGLFFEFEGEVNEPVTFDRDLIQERYGERFAPVLVGWSDASATPDLGGSTAGLGGSSSVSGAYGDQRFLAAGVVILDREDFAELLATEAGQGRAASIVRHELAHVVGLGHVDDTTEVMHTENLAAVSWGPGDRQALAIAGAGPCQ
ncbi:hypothetical protein ON058_07955 [Demequina sp. B12]|uniref:hypothetical protein n=1 Tax=Demequina sp. B12 TaxID=2992757 RepID=UPI00237B241E|nr:hypothetical protein [Demequina sp. B12]MDE0573346.1 hypothetical protein [Demequina sp. B12]